MVSLLPHFHLESGLNMRLKNKSSAVTPWPKALQWLWRLSRVKAKVFTVKAQMSITHPTGASSLRAHATSRALSWLLRFLIPLSRTSCLWLVFEYLRTGCSLYTLLQNIQMICSLSSIFLSSKDSLAIHLMLPPDSCNSLSRLHFFFL